MDVLIDSTRTDTCLEFIPMPACIPAPAIAHVAPPNPPIDPHLNTLTRVLPACPPTQQPGTRGLCVRPHDHLSHHHYHQSICLCLWPCMPRCPTPVAPQATLPPAPTTALIHPCGVSPASRPPHPCPASGLVCRCLASYACGVSGRRPPEAQGTWGATSNHSPGRMT